ncbi:MAG: nucleotidyltransferase family protein [Candidatus Bipolaricaulota bacterium]
MIAPLVLAAGRGTRMGGLAKPLVEVGGVPALARILAALQGADLGEAIVVLGPEGDAVRARIDLTGCQVVWNLTPERGLSTSLAAGLAAVPDAALGVLVLHADMPLIRATTLRAVAAAALKGASLAAPRHAGRRGFPVYIARQHFSSLTATLTGDEGARHYLEMHAGDLQLIDVDDAGCLFDFDRPEDLAQEEILSWTTCV